MKRYNIDHKYLGIEYQDAGPWRSYELDAHGDSLEELIDDATISETDRSGETMHAYGLDDASESVSDVVMNEFYRIIAKKEAFDAQVREEQKIKGND